MTATLLKITLLHGCSSRFLNCTNGTKSHKASQLNHVYHLSGKCNKEDITWKQNEIRKNIPC